ncbi:MAG TPA: hypothetical protein VHI13_21125 [Candidatus Kapabacteria bacterium]|nr:hypothetical protein [Candidatus Kapabacteria bacterium]
MSDIAFYILALLGIAAAAAAVAMRAALRATVALAAGLCCVAGLFVLLGGAVAGGVLIACVCVGLLILRRSISRAPEIIRQVEEPGTARRFPAMLVAVAIGAILVTVAWTTPAWRDAVPATIAGAGTPETIGGMLAGDDILPLLIAILAVPVAIAGATVLPWRKGGR